MGVRKGRRTSIGEQFAPRLVRMLESFAYRALSLSARRLLDRIEIERAHHGGNDNGQLPVTYENFEEYGIDRGAIAPAIREAVALGFLEVTEQGCAGNAEFRSPNKFRLTYVPAAGVTSEWGKGGWELFANLEGAKAEAQRARKEKSARPYRPARRKKQNSSMEKNEVSMGETDTENQIHRDGKSTLHVLADKSALLSISRAGDRESI